MNNHDQERARFEAWFSQSGMEKFKETAWAGWQARAQQPASVAVPEGWKLVPFKPGKAILDAINLLCDDGSAFDDSEAFWHFLLDAAPAPEVRQETGLHPFAEKIITKLQRCASCFEDGQGADIGRHWLDLLTQLGLLNRVQRSPALWEITQQGEDALAAHRAQQGEKP